MYETQVFENIIRRMLSKVPKDTDIREGSVIYDALAPAAMELESLYIALNVILQETFADTNTRPYLIRRCAERGILPDPAFKAVLKGKFNIQVPIGSRFSLDDLNYIVISYIEQEVLLSGYYIYQVECETAGIVGNGKFGKLIPIQYIDGLTYAQITELLIPGEDEQSTESLRQEYFDSFNMVAYGGNIADYKKKVLDIPGLGAVKVTPVWQGGGTVRLTILDAEHNKASDTLIETVQTLIDPTQDQKGLGIAPIGHIVTVDTAADVAVNISLHVDLENGFEWEQVKTPIEEVIKDYLLELRKTWAPNDKPVSDDLIVRVAKIEAAILNISGIVDVYDTKINGVAGNLNIGAYEIPVFGSVNRL